MSYHQNNEQYNKCNYSYPHIYIETKVKLFNYNKMSKKN